MRFEITVAALLLMVACSQKNNAQQSYIGEKLEDATPLYQSDGLPADELFLIDDPTHRILKLNLGDLTIAQAYPMAKPTEKHTLASHGDGSYVIDFSPKSLEIIRADGGRESRPFAFAGTPVSAAYRSKDGIFVMQDDLQSIGLMVLSDAGEVQKSWLGGPLLGQDKLLLAGDVDGDGRLILAVSDKSALIVDVAASIDGKAWQFASFATDIDKIYWLAPDNEANDFTLVLADDAIATLNLASKAVVDKKSLSDNHLVVLARSKWIKPHVLVNNTDTGHREIYFVGPDGKLASQELPDLTLAGDLATSLNAEATELTALSSNGNLHRVTKLRMSDNLVVFDNTIASKGEAKLGVDILFVDKKSPLGYLQAHNLNDDTVKELKGYNFEYFRQE